MKAINDFLLRNGLRIVDNPCISPDFCLDWVSLCVDIRHNRGINEYDRSRFFTDQGEWHLLENDSGDHAWRLSCKKLNPGGGPLEDGILIGDSRYFPASYENLIAMKNLVQEHDAKSSIFPGAGKDLANSTLGIGARFTTLHWPGVDWAMANLGIGLTANQNSIPRELVFDVNAMLTGTLDSVPFPFIGANVPEGHQGQSVEGMSHGAILTKLKYGFHQHGIPWSFNADHQPIGGKFDEREDQLVAGCLFASYITFDISPELALTKVPEDPSVRRAFVSENIDTHIVHKISRRIADTGLVVDEAAMDSLLCYVWNSMVKMKQRDEKYRIAREQAFSTATGRKYLRELSIDELPGLTTPETTAVMLALSEAMGMPVDFVAPAFGFQKNMPYPDNEELQQMIDRQWQVCKAFGVSIGFHSGSGKSAENYQIMGSITGGNLEIKTSGRYTYEMGVALSKSDDFEDQKLWRDWYEFTRSLALAGAFSEEKTERILARQFIQNALDFEGRDATYKTFEECREVLAAFEPNPEHMFWFEYNFLYVLAADGNADKQALGDHSPAGYRQRARFYSISDTGRLEFARRIAAYIVFLAGNAGLVSEETCSEACARLKRYSKYNELLDDIFPPCEDL